MSRKVCVIALDGATLELITPWTEAGHLPNLKKLIDGGASGELETTFPPLTGPAWTSFMTGKTPSNHSVQEFFRRKPDTYRQILNSRYDIDGQSIWRLLSDAGKKVVVMGVPLCYPPEAVNGSLITGLLTPSQSRDFTYPLTLLEELEDELGEYRLRHDEKYRKSDPQPFIQEQHEILANNTEAALYLIQNKEWDFFMVHFLGTDRIQHEFWHVMDKTHPQHDPKELEELGDVIFDFFKEVDVSVGKLTEALAQKEEDVTIMIMSDHGFGPIHKFVNMNTWLLNEGWLRLKPSAGTLFRRLVFRCGFNYSIMAQWVLKLGFGRKAKTMGRGRREDLQRQLFLSLNDVDWTKTRAYSIGNFGQIYVNLKGREPDGVVEPGAEYDAVVAEITEKLKALKDPENGEQIVAQVFRREELYEGIYAEDAPDVMFFTKEMLYKPMGLSDFSSPNLLDPVYGTTGHHRSNGTFICYNPDLVPSGQKVEGSYIYDLAPTILHLMGNPVPQEMDGRVLQEIFNPQFQETPVEYVKTADDQARKDPAYSEEQEGQLKDMLRSLGYVN